MVIDFHGYLMVMAPEGQAPQVWRVKMDLGATCETCSAKPGRGMPMYRTLDQNMGLYALDLGICQACMQDLWENRLQDRVGPDPAGVRMHIFPPR